MQKAFFLVTVLASTLTLAAAPVALAQSDPAALLKKHAEESTEGMRLERWPCLPMMPSSTG